jgi:hypothetical protein
MLIPEKGCFMFRTQYLAAAIGLSLLTGCSDDSSPPSAPRPEPAAQLSIHPPAVTTTRFQLREVAAQASFDTFDPASCIDTQVSVFGTPQARKDGLPQPHTYVDAFAYNLCTNEQVLGVYGATVDARFQVDSRLTTASLQATMVGWNYIHETADQIDVDVSWTGSGELLTQSNRSRVKVPGFMMNQWFKGTSRDAIASGTVSVGGKNLALNPAYYAQIFRAKSGELEIVRTDR